MRMPGRLPLCLLPRSMTPGLRACPKSSRRATSSSVGCIWLSPCLWAFFGISEKGGHSVAHTGSVPHEPDMLPGIALLLDAVGMNRQDW